MEPTAAGHDPYQQPAPAAEAAPVAEPPRASWGNDDGSLTICTLTNDKGEPLVILRSGPPTPEYLAEEHRRQTKERARRQRRWGPRSETMRGSLRALTALLDRALAVEPRSIDEWRELVEELHFHFPLAEAGRVLPQEFRAAAALAEVWIPKGGDQVGAALEWACGHPDKLRQLYTAVRGGRRPLPWRVLRPLSRLHAFEVRPHRSGYAIPPPSAATLAALPELRARYLDFMKKIKAALSAGEALQRWRFEQAKMTRLDGTALDRAFAASIAARLGDQLTQAEVIDDAVHALYTINETVHASSQRLAEYLAGTKPGTLDRGGVKTLKALGDIAAGLARVINPCIRDRRRYPNKGVYRAEVQDRVVAIIAAVYGVSLPPPHAKEPNAKTR